jgi:hypothetical protein
MVILEMGVLWTICLGWSQIDLNLPRRCILMFLLEIVKIFLSLNFSAFDLGQFPRYSGEVFFFFFFLIAVLHIESRTLHLLQMLDRCSTTELCPQPLGLLLYLERFLEGS